MGASIARKRSRLGHRVLRQLHSSCGSDLCRVRFQEIFSTSFLLFSAAALQRALLVDSFPSEHQFQKECLAAVGFQNVPSTCEMTSCFSTKRKSLLSLPRLYRSRAMDQHRWVRFAGGFSVFLHAFSSCLFRVAGSCNVCFFCLIQLSVLIFVGEEKERVCLDRHTFLVSCSSEHHLRKERSSAPSK